MAAVGAFALLQDQPVVIADLEDPLGTAAIAEIRSRFDGFPAFETVAYAVLRFVCGYRTGFSHVRVIRLRRYNLLFIERDLKKRCRGGNPRGVPAEPAV
jgi:hypothetical protein